MHQVIKLDSLQKLLQFVFSVHSVHMHIYGMSRLPSASDKIDIDSNIFNINFYGSKSTTPPPSPTPPEVEENPPMYIPSYHIIVNPSHLPNSTPDYVLVKEDLSGKAETVEEDEIEDEISRPDTPTQASNFKISCDVCTRVYSSRKRFENHLEKCGILAEMKKLFNCADCQKHVRLKTLIKHQQSHILTPAPISLPEDDPTLPTVLDLFAENPEAHVIEPPAAVLEPRKPSIFHNIALLAKSETRRR